ncbi:TPA: LysM peptidoglycan-binding domain-containing protein [Clostridioides difficile]|uniref:LysM peptidoglycan-binding domain-containing protein n=3 Tax=Clostridioides difficile TaxID=1496 RepID=A0A9P3U2A7_CLODI|nr:LysM peptidoglycan-binding domain-containing protein [Clostridioides difficile]OFU42208.1 peptidoglycan-binding protein LysM [Clostridium sp. HMSC19A11]QVW56620.1 LysM [Clostridioides phage CD1801]HDN2469782.1 LysM peptidoglycan-binding domain-containing protein [Clostridioides difficile CD196]EGT3685978.1 LysM peptidoglycan-binding domain-containing protein [Clostridioides difficile]
MEMWIRQANDTFRFPVFPSSFEINSKAIVNTSNVLKLGEIAVFGGVGLRTTEISSFFPRNEASYCDYTGFPSPYDCVNKIQRWMNEGFILRFTITETNINFECIITDFQYEEKDCTGDVYFTLSLKEYRRIQISKVSINNDEKLSSVKDVPLTKGFDTKQKTHKVGKGDSLWSLAKKYYGNGDLWKKIYDANKKLIKNPDIIKDGWVLVIP